MLDSTSGFDPSDIQHGSSTSLSTSAFDHTSNQNHIAMQKERKDLETNGESNVGKAHLWSLLAGVILLVLGNGLQTTLVGVRAGLEGMNGQTVGLIMSAYFIGYAGGSVLSPRLIHVVGHIRAFAALAAVTSAIALCFPILPLPFVWIGLRVIHGACYAGLVVIVESWLNASTTRNQRGRVLATYMVVLYAGWSLSQLLLNVASPRGFILFSLVSACLSLALVPITATGIRAPGIVTSSRLGLRALYAISPLAVVGAFMTGATVSAFFGMGPTFAQSSGLTDIEISAFLAIMLVGALIFQWPLGWLSDRIDRRFAIIGCAFASFLIAIALWLTDQNIETLLILSLLLGGTMMPIYSLCVAHANDGIDAEHVVAAASEMILVYGIGSAFGPSLAGLAMNQLGPSGLFAFVGAGMAAYGFYAAFRVRQRAPIPGEEKQIYVAVPQTSHAALHLHRHGPDTIRDARDHVSS
ncbi:MFS transporter [Consotaella salsifontis]|uniref:Predicted arabinose efflux permease, MFS family n=1 Tax=Consotaella salsifontis TaxID=1365950 RepID=A0A1T4S9I6_9HYPH|nr:MFS transporter [Consotaella salsifontis]SKA24970.1 Predicted arabinose efflux permease, MFS family [Consotaella salsifontis]